MMSTALSKNKEKRPRSSSEHNKSFVKNVTSRVSGLLPATITKWFSSPSSSNTNGSAQAADATDSSTEDEAPESPVTIQPPAKRMRYTSPGNVNQCVPVETRCISTNTESIDDSSSAVPVPIERSNFRRDHFMSTHVQHTSDGDSLDGSTQDNSFFKSKQVLSPLGHSMVQKRKSIFENTTDDSYRRPSPTYSGNVRDPYFKPSFLSSPFYVGRTMYGGAASSYMTQPNVKQRKISLTEKTSNSNSVTISHSARCVMDLLEHYSSPLIEAKRIPQIESHQASNSLDSSQQKVNPYGSRVFSYKTQELIVPSIASIMSLKRKARLMDTTNTARQIIASHSSSSDYYSPYQNSKHTAITETDDKMTTKIKARLTRTNRDRNMEEESNNPDTVILPNVVLQIDKDNLPKFTFEPLNASETPKISSIQTPVIITPEAMKLNAESDKLLITKTNVDKSTLTSQEDTDNDSYKFPSPAKVTNQTNTKTPTKFNFGSPERHVEKEQGLTKTDLTLASNTSINNISEIKFPVEKSLNWKCLDCWVSNNPDANSCVCCGGKKPIEIDNSKKCSICNISISQTEFGKCNECEKKTKNIDTANKGNNSKWKCNDCWVNNDESVVKCVCCGGKKSSPKVSVEVANNVENVWKCNECGINNKNSLNKCATCSTLMSGSEQVISSLDIAELPKTKQELNEIKTISDNTFRDIVMSQKDKWICSICLIRNENDRVTCYCCEADKPGIVKEEHKRLFNFHQPSEITFKFGIQPENQLNKMQEHIETEESSMCEESETNNNILPKTPTFNFGLSFKKVDEQVEPATEISGETPKLNFKFGMSNQTLSPTKNLIFGMPNKLPEITKNVDEKEKLQVVPRVFTPPKSDAKSTGLFTAPVTSQSAQAVPAMLSSSTLNQPSVTNEGISFHNTTVVPTTVSEAKTQQGGFTFSPITSVPNLFVAPIAATTSISTTPSLSTAVTSTMSLFQKAEPIASTTTSLFQTSDSKLTLAASAFNKTEVTATTACTSTGVTRPIFSFGNTGATSQPEKPKFQFTFGSNKKESPPLFNTTFGASSDNNNASTKFNLASNSITGGNVLSGNLLNNTPGYTGNVMTTANSTTNAPAPNPFGAPVQKENMWAPNNNMLFSSNASTNTVQKPPAFTFGTATPFNANNNSGAATQFNANNNNGTTMPFNTNNTVFGNASQPAQNMFGIPNQTGASQSMFGNQINNQSAPIMFGTPQAPSNVTTMGMFGNSNAGVTPVFGTSNTVMPSFETPSLTPGPAPTFNFGCQQQAPGVFGFGQPQQNQAQLQSDAQQHVQPQLQPQQQQPNMYNFGTPNVGATQLQFNMGSAPNTPGRRVYKKALRRTQR